MEWTVTMSVSVIVSESCLSLGDALRDLDAKALIRGDFILLNVDTVTNIDFRSILEKHKYVNLFLRLGFKFDSKLFNI